MVRHDYFIGSGSTLVALAAVPAWDTAQDLLGKLVFAIVSAVIASLISGVVRSWSERKFGK